MMAESNNRRSWNNTKGQFRPLQGRTRSSEKPADHEDLGVPASLRVYGVDGTGRDRERSISQLEGLR